MRRIGTLAALVFAACLVPVWAQQSVHYTDDKPLPPPVPFSRDSGVLGNSSSQKKTVHVEPVRVPGAAWLRLYFGEDAQLAEGSYLRITSELDGEVQTLDSEALALWQNSTAYFNGDSIRIDLVAGAHTTDNRLVVERLAYTESLSPDSLCGADDRVVSDEDWSGRIQPNGCSGAMWTESGCMISAGHCFDSPSDAQVIEFRVPLNNGSCQHQHPAVDDQFPILPEDFWSSLGVGNDWAVAMTGTNTVGQTPFERYGQIRRIALSIPPTGQPMEIWGYGSDSECLLDNVQQFSEGSITGLATNSVSHNADTEGGSSGSGVLHDGEIFAAHTHAGCPTNRGTRIDLPSFASARAQLCIPEAGVVRLDREAYTCNDSLTVRVEDSSLIGAGVQDVMLSSTSETLGETVTLNEAYAAVLGGTFSIDGQAAVAGDGKISVSHGDTLSVTYLDADDGNGAPEVRTATATVDCELPVIDDLTVDSITELSAVIHWTTDAPAVGSVSVELPSGPLTLSDPIPRTQHSFLVTPLTGCTGYTYSVTAVDAAGNTTVDDNAGAQHPFASFCPAPPTVPDGSHGGAPLRATTSGDTRLRLFWDNACVGTGPSKVLYGPIETVAQHEISGSVCGIPADTAHFGWLGIPSESFWFLIVEDNGFGIEGSWGDATAGERNGLAVSGQCGATSKVVSGGCTN